VRIEHSSGLSQAEIDKMKKDAELHADEDKRKRELADVKSEGEQKAHQFEKMLKEAGDKLGEADKAPLVRAIDKVKDAVKGSDLSAIKAAISDLDAAAQAVGQHLQAAAAAGGANPGAAPGGDKKGSNDDVIDAEYEVKK
jgi:molecular chaperone DnaK